MNRPRCKRCKGRLDIWWEPDELNPTWICNNPHGKDDPILSDDEFSVRVTSLTNNQRIDLFGTADIEEAEIG